MVEEVTGKIILYLVNVIGFAQSRNHIEYLFLLV
jgi:hypothetical protein